MGEAWCAGVLCGVPPREPNSRRPGAMVRYPFSVDYTCQLGYSTDPTVPLAGGPKGFNVKCQTTGIFADPEVYLPVECGESPSYPCSSTPDCAHTRLVTIQ